MEATQQPNPFHKLYLTEAMTDPDLYWDLFSPQIITGEAQKLFGTGNIVLLGSNGTGKSMLLRLLAPAVQAAYLHQKKRLPTPLASQISLSVNINFVVAGVDRLGTRPVSDDVRENVLLWSIMFGDYINYFVAREIMNTLEFLAGEGRPLAQFLEAQVDQERLEAFAKWLAPRDCWFGALEGSKSFCELKELLGRRLFCYRVFSNWNSHLPTELSESKSEIALPLIECRRGLEKFGILGPHVPLIVTIDQYETLLHRDYETATDPDVSMGRALCRVVNAFMATRSPEVSYKVAVRPYSWNREMRIFGSEAKLELERDYQRVDLDEILSRKENTSAWIFPAFARDVASRRMAWVLGGEAKDYSSWFPERFVNLTADEELKRYCDNDEDRLLPQDSNWPEEWNKALAELYQRNKFEAKFAETWIRQYLGKSGVLPKLPDDLKRGEWTRPWWQKERREALLMQIASGCQQRRIYGGADTILTLSGYNITIFISLCREIWDSNERARSKRARGTGRISVDVQTEAIRRVSENWFNKIEEFSGGAKRQNFVARLGIGIKNALIADKGLVYPGHNGFSLLLEEYEQPEAAGVRHFLENARDFGSLVSSKHTTKERDRRLRRKWYIFPLLCVNFEIPIVRTKEPYYADLAEVTHWLSDARPPIVLKGPRARKKTGKTKKEEEQASLFSENGGGKL